MIDSSIHADRPQNLSEEFEDRVFFLLGHLVVAVLLPAGIDLRTSEAGFRVDAGLESRVSDTGAIWGRSIGRGQARVLYFRLFCGYLHRDRSPEPPTLSTAYGTRFSIIH